MLLARRTATTTLFAASLLAFCGIAPVHAADTTIQALIGETGSWDSNPLMQISGAKSLYGSITSPELIFNDNTPTLKFSADTLVNENIFNLSSFDSTDVHENINLMDQASPRWAYGGQAKVDYDTTRTSEVSNFNLTNKSVRHTGYSVAPQITYNSTQIDQFMLKGSAALSQYESSTFSDYELFTVDPTYAHNFDPLNSGTFDVLAQHYETTNGPLTKNDAFTPSIGWQTSMTPRLTVKASAGPEISRQTGAGGDKPWKLSYGFMGDLSYKGIQDITDVTASRAQTPFGNGTEALSTIFNVTEKHAINELFSVNVGAIYETADYQTSTPLSLDTLAGGNGGLTYHATDHIDVTAAYQYRHETFTSTSGTADDHTGTVNLTYHPKEWGL